MVTLISGNPGAGKSTVTTALQRLGIRALDADAVPGLAAWLDRDGAVVGDGTLVPTPRLLADCYWGWSGPRLDEVVHELGPMGVLLGIAVNQWDFMDRFDRLVLLELDETVQETRIESRHPLVQEQIRRGLPVLQAQMIERGAIRIDATAPASSVAAAVVDLLR